MREESRWLVLALSMLWLVPAPAWAASITPTLEGCVTELPEGEASWTAPEHFQMVAFWDPVAGCGATIYYPMVLHEWFENYDGTGGLKTVTLRSRFPTCGRIQFDAHSYLSYDVLDPMGLKSLVFDTGIDCEGGGWQWDEEEDVPAPGSLLLTATALVLWHVRRMLRRPRA